MASSSGNSSGSAGQITNSGSEGDLQTLMDERKRKRMQSNRESARRSRMRKQQHLDEMMAQSAQLKEENGQIQGKINATTQHFMAIEAENSVLRAQMMELSHRLQSLNDILSYIDSCSINGVFDSLGDDCCFQQTGGGIPPHQANYLMNNGGSSSSNPWMLMNQQPIMASADFLQY